MLPFFALLALSLPLFAEHRVLSGNVQERLIAVVPMTGAGTLKDPRRPLFAPIDPDPMGIISYSYDLSDDRKYAIVEFVARDKKAFAAILSDSRVVKAFQKDKDKREDVEREIKKVKADFQLGKGETGSTEGGK